MAKKPKLDLTNYRGAKQARTQYVFDSSCAADLMSLKSSSASTARYVRF